jgi:hypothetical protein
MFAFRSLIRRSEKHQQQQQQAFLSLTIKVIVLKLFDAFVESTRWGQSIEFVSAWHMLNDNRSYFVSLSIFFMFVSSSNTIGYVRTCTCIWQSFVYRTSSVTIFVNNIEICRHHRARYVFACLTSMFLFVCFDMYLLSCSNKLSSVMCVNQMMMMREIFTKKEKRVCRKYQVTWFLSISSSSSAAAVAASSLLSSLTSFASVNVTSRSCSTTSTSSCR